MFNASEDFNTAVESLSRCFCAKMESENFEFTDEIKSFCYKNGIGCVSFGKTCCASLELEIDGKFEFAENLVFKLSVGLDVENGRIEFMPLGEFLVSTAENTEDNSTKITAYDKMFCAEKIYNSDLAFPATSVDMLKEIAQKIGVSVETEGLEEYVVENAPVGYTMREILGYLSGLYGKFCVIDKEGVLRLKWFQNEGATTDLDHIKAPVIGASQKINGIGILNGESVVYSVGDQNSIEVENPYMTLEILQKVWQNLQGFEFFTGKIEMVLGDPRLDVWDMLTVDNSSLPILDFELNFDGGISAKITAEDTLSVGESVYKTPEEIEKQRIKQDLLDLGKIVADKATISDLEVTNSFVTEISQNVTELSSTIEDVREEVSTILRIESSRGTVFKNDSVSTVLSVVIYHGKNRITDIDTLRKDYGNTAYIEWEYQHMKEDTFSVLSANDPRISNDGFSLTLSPEDVDTKITFMATLKT